MTRRARKVYFEREPGAPAPLQWDVRRRVRFSEVDALGIAWHGRYVGFFEEASAELGRRCGLSYRDFFEAGLYAPIVQLHVDYLQPLRLDEEFTIRGRLLWAEGARLNSEYELIKADGALAARGYTVQLFTLAESGLPCAVVPPLLAACRQRWQAGELKALQA